MGTMNPDFFEQLVDTSVSPFVVLDADGYVLFVGRSIEDLLGKPAGEYLGRHFLEVIAPESHENALAAYTAFAQGDTPQPWIGPGMILDLCDANGDRVPCEVAAVSPAANNIGGAILQVRRAQGTRLLYEVMDSIVLDVPLPVVLELVVALAEHDLPGSVITIAWNWDGDRFHDTFGAHPAIDLGAITSSVDEMTPWERAVTTGQTIGEADLASLSAEARRGAERAGFAECWAVPIAIDGNQEATAALVVWRRLAGPPAPHLMTAVERAARLVGLALEFRRSRAHWQREARTDNLTGLANRAALTDQLELLMTADHEFVPVALLYCDLDDFKPVNDQYGHAIGDAVLGVVAKRIVAAVRPGDIVARVGGDEIAVVCRLAAGDLPPVEVAQRLIAVVSEPIVIDQHLVRVGLSVGVTVANSPVEPRALLHAADTALLAAKGAGKNRFVVHPIA